MGIDTFFAKIGSEKRERLKTRLVEVNRDISRNGIRSVSGMTSNLAGVGSELLTGYSYGEFYDWDLYFENIYLSYYGIHRYCRTNLEEFLNRQLESGFVSRTLLNPRWRQHFKPFLAQTALLGCRQSGDYRWLKFKFYDRLKKYLEYWFWYCDHDRNGLPVWNSADHSGLDNQTCRAGNLDSETVEGVDLACYLVRELRAMSVLAQALNCIEDQVEFETHAVKLSALINNTFWDDTDGFYYDRDERRNSLIKVKSVVGFLPLWLGIVPAERADRMVAEHLHNPAEFWLAYPVASYSKTEPDYYQERQSDECNWRGTAWIPTNYMIFHGLCQSGYSDLAGELAYRSFEMALAEETTREYYNAETGSGQGLNPFWGWSTLAYLMPLEYELGYNPTDHQSSIQPIASEILDFQDFSKRPIG